MLNRREHFGPKVEWAAMSLIVAENITIAFGGQTVLRNVTLRLEWGQRIGLVGPNGCGKTTLISILAGELEPDAGRVSVARGVRIGTLRQEHDLLPGNTVLQEAERALAALAQLERRMRECETLMAQSHGSQLEALLEEYAALHDRWEAMGGHDLARDVSRVLTAMGFAESDWSRPVATLSGGQKTRLALARMALAGTEVLLLDEPTNHLDLSAIEWLETYLNDFGGAVILVSHDRRFLENTVSAILELDTGKLRLYRCGFEEYWQRREQERIQAEEAARRKEEEIARLEEFWRRNKAGQNRNMAMSRLRAAQKLRSQEPMEIPSRLTGPTMRVTAASRGGNEVIVAKKLSKAYGTRLLFSDLTLTVTRGQRVGIVGPNGSGKSTFLRIVLGLEPPSSGTVRFGAGVEPGYLAQDAADVAGDATVLETVQAETLGTEEEVRTCLARFQFRGDDVFKRLSQLSGGERSRVALARIILRRPNLLVLDEPTNHLDIFAREALAEMLRSYDGTVLVASHDRYLLDSVATHLLWIADGSAETFAGNYTEFRRRQSSAARPNAAKPPQPASTSSDEPRPRTSFELSRLRRQAQKTLASSERHVLELEDLVKRLEECLSHPTPQDDVVALALQYEQARAELEKAFADWAKAVEDAEQLGLTA